MKTKHPHLNGVYYDPILKELLVVGILSERLCGMQYGNEVFRFDYVSNWLERRVYIGEL